MYENGSRIWSRKEFPINVLYIQQVNPIAKSAGTINSTIKDIIPKVIANENGNIIAFEIKG